MKIKILALITFVLASVNSNSQDAFLIKGTVANNFDGYIFLSYGAKRDSALVKNKKFIFKGTVDYPVESRLHIKNGFSASSIFLENSSMEIEVTIYNSVTYINSISGNSTEAIKEDLINFFQKLESDPDFATKLFNKLDSIFIQNPRNQFFGMVLADIAMNPILTRNQVLYLLSKLDQTVQGQETIESINVSLLKFKNFKTGTKFKSFELPDTIGNQINTSNFKGKILLITFWASWCGHCIQNNSELLKLYDNYSYKDFEIFSVSLDLEKKSWVQAIEKGALPWVNTIAKGGWGNKVIESLGIQSVPSNFLIDKSGKIIAINIKPTELKIKLDELLK